jgi:hypothetical protein
MVKKKAPCVKTNRGENNKAPRIYLGALNLFILRREQDSLFPKKL